MPESRLERRAVPNFRRDPGVPGVKIELAEFVHRGDQQFGAGLFAYKLPRDDVRVMFEVRDQDLVARPDSRTAETLCNEVDRLRCATRQDDFAAAGRIDE